MASNANEQEDFPPGYTFDNILKIIPTCHAFLKLSGTSEVGVETPPNWKKCVLDEVRGHLPSTFTQIDPPTNFFNCRKSVYKQSWSVVQFSRSVYQILDEMGQISRGFYRLVDQRPRSGNINRISSFFILAVKLVEVVPWDTYDTPTCTYVMKNLDQIVKDLKAFRLESERHQSFVDSLAASAKKIFRAGPYVDQDRNDGSLRRWTMGRNQNHEDNLDANASDDAADVKIGLTQADELVVADGLVKLVRISPNLKLALLVMILRHLKTLLSTTGKQLTQINTFLKNLKLPKKWRTIHSTQLTIFEIALLRKSNFLLTESTTELKILTLFLSNNTKFLYELRRPFKVLRKNLSSSAYDPIIRHSFVMFQVHLRSDTPLKQYVEKDCFNQNAANYIIQHFGTKKSN